MIGKNTKIILTSNACHLGEQLKQKRKIIYPAKNRDGRTVFPDGEVYAALPNLHKKDNYLVIHSGMPNPNDSLMELKIVLECLKNSKAKSVEIFFSYFPYSMQDNIFDPGESNVAESIVKELLFYYKVDKIYTLDAHFYGKKWVTNYPLKNFSALKTIKVFLNKKYSEITLLAPDIGGHRRTGLMSIEKRRINSFETIPENSEILEDIVKNKVIGVVDDIIETGGTLERFYYECKKYGAKKIIAVITHGVLPNGIERINKIYDDLLLTNSIDNEESNVDISGLIIEKLKL